MGRPELGLCIPVEHPVGLDLLATLKRQTWRRVRVDVHYGFFERDHRIATDQLREFLRTGIPEPLFLLAHGTMKQWPEEDALVDHVDDVRVKMRDLRLVDRLRRIRGRF